MEKHERRMTARFELPMAIGADARAGLGLEKTRSGRRKTVITAPPKGGGESHQMGVAQERMGLEISHASIYVSDLRAARKVCKGDGAARAICDVLN